MLSRSDTNNQSIEHVLATTVNGYLLVTSHYALLNGDDEEAGSGPGRLFCRACIHDTSHQPVPRHQDHPAPGPALKRHTTLPLSPAE